MVEACGFDLHLEHGAAAFDQEVLRSGVAVGLGDAQAEFGGASEKAQLDELALQLVGFVFLHKGSFSFRWVVGLRLTVCGCRLAPGKTTAAGCCRRARALRRSGATQNAALKVEPSGSGGLFNSLHPVWHITGGNPATSCGFISDAHAAA